MVDSSNMWRGVLKPGAILCLIDLDYNCLTHFEMPERLEKNNTRNHRDGADKGEFRSLCGEGNSIHTFTSSTSPTSKYT